MSEDGGGSPILRRKRGKQKSGRKDDAKDQSPGDANLVNCNNSRHGNPTSDEQHCSDYPGGKLKSPLCERTPANDEKKTSQCDIKIVKEASLDTFLCTVAASNTLSEIPHDKEYGRLDTPHGQSETHPVSRSQNLLGETSPKRQRLYPLSKTLPLVSSSPAAGLYTVETIPVNLPNTFSTVLSSTTKSINVTSTTKPSASFGNTPVNLPTTSLDKRTTSPLSATPENLPTTSSVYRTTPSLTASSTTVKAACFPTAYSLLKEEMKSNTFLSLGCPLIDRALGGGIRRSALTEVAGESGAGKTQFCLQCSLQASRRGERTVYICTEGAFPQARLDQMVGAQVDLLAKVLVKQVRDLHHLLAVLGKQLEEVVNSVVLVVVDSVAGVVRSDPSFNRGKLERSGAVHKIGQRLLRIALKYGVAVLAVNQATDRMEEEVSSDGRATIPSLGMTWAFYPNTRLWISKTSKVISRTPSVLLQGLQADTRLRKMEVDSSCRLPTSTTHFIVETDGLRGVRIAAPSVL